MDFEEERRDVWVHARRMWEAGLVAGSAGNVSRRAGAGHLAITPTSVPYDAMTFEQVAVVEVATGQVIHGAPSYELPMHLVVYRSSPRTSAIIHTHSPFVTTLSVLRRPLPPVIDEMMRYFGGQVEVTGYAFTGTEAVGQNVVAALGDRAGVILANHGNVCTGATLAEALAVAITMESCARVYVQALAIGEPVRLPESAITAGRRLFELRSQTGADRIALRSPGFETTEKS